MRWLLGSVPTERTDASRKLFVLQAEKAAKRKFRVGKDPQTRERKGDDRIYVVVPNLPVHIVRRAYASRHYKL